MDRVFNMQFILGIMKFVNIYKNRVQLSPRRRSHRSCRRSKEVNVVESVKPDEVGKPEDSPEDESLGVRTIL